MSLVWLKQYLPRTLYGRAALILLLPVVFLQLVVTFLFISRHFEDVTLQMTQTVARELALVLEVANQAPAAEAVPETVERRLGALKIKTLPMGNPGAVTRRWYDLSGRVILNDLPRRVPEITAIDLPDNNRVDVYADSVHGTLRMRFDRPRISATNPHQLFVNMVFFGALVTIIAFLYLRNQLRPIKRLARAAEAFGRGHHLPYTPAGAVEVRAAGGAFVDMRNRIERQIEQRTLMLSGVSHDLRTPLTRMRLSLAMLDAEDAEPLLQDVDDMQGMLDAFLNFAKGDSEGQMEAVDPFVLTEHVVADAVREGRSVTLLPREGQGEGTVMLNPVAIRRAVGNLISNAVRYGANAEVSVMLSEKALRIRVDDDGPGIPQDMRVEATRPFTRLDPARQLTKGGNVGLGLAIATDIARAHGGVLRLGESVKMGGLRADIVIAR